MAAEVSILCPGSSCFFFNIAIYPVATYIAIYPVATHMQKNITGKLIN